MEVFCFFFFFYFCKPTNIYFGMIVDVTRDGEKTHLPHILVGDTRNGAGMGEDFSPGE